MTKLTALTVVAVLLLANAKPSSLAISPRLCWTSWYDRDDPSGTGDWEDLKSLRMVYPGEICDAPLRIQAVTVDGNVPAESTGQEFYAYNTQLGFFCRNADQPSGQQCLDYKVRFRCPCPEIECILPC